VLLAAECPKSETELGPRRRSTIAEPGLLHDKDKDEAMMARRWWRVRRDHGMASVMRTELGRPRAIDKDGTGGSSASVMIKYGIKTVGDEDESRIETAQSQRRA